ncbi:MAG: YbaB/EbfC family nucleoid-associated protein [Candidatus Latescibacteria bacterium]|nr:YbaB/EbfC family nucleoid-associated protein [Candidatus Latescibacterota bacterium]
MKMDINKLTQTMGKITEQMQEIQNKVRVESSVGGGMVKVSADGGGNIISITLEPELIKGAETDIEMLQDLIVAAVNQAKDLAKTEAQNEMQKMVGFPLDGLLPH